LKSRRAAAIADASPSEQDRSMSSRARLYFDGGHRPAGMEIAVVWRGVAHIADDLGPGTSMAAEWHALIAAVRLALANGIANPVFLGDSRAVVAQATGIVRARGAAVEQFDAFRRLTAAMPHHVRYIPRSRNLAGIALDRRHDGAGRQPFPCVTLP
jgi:ribonuclease HI